MYDVAVVGAGPAGAWAAKLLAERGARVLLLDPSHPREKPCGGGVTGRALALVRNSMVLEALPSVAVRRARFLDSRARTAASVAFDDDATLVVVSRAEFDGRLLAAAGEAGADPVSARVTELTTTGRGFRLTTAEGHEF